MKKLILMSLAIMLSLINLFAEGKEKRSLYYITNQVPLIAQPYTELPLGAIKPQGWLLEQLNIMDEGSTGHLDEVFSMIKDDNGWLGGER